MEIERIDFMKKTALELIEELRKKHDLWSKALKEKRIEFKDALKISEGKYEALTSGIGSQLAEGNTSKANELKKERNQVKAEIDELKDNLTAIEKASGVRNFVSDLDGIWKLITEEYNNLQDRHSKAESQWGEFNEKAAEFERKAILARKEMTDLSIDIGSFDPIIKLAAVLSNIYTETDIVGVEKELYSKWQGIQPESLSDNWRLSIYTPEDKALSNLLHDIFGKIANNETANKPPKWA